MATPRLNFDSSTLPIAQLESLKFKANQIVESIMALRATVDAGHQNMMLPWPDILSKYNILLSQTLNFSNSLGATIGGANQTTGRVSNGNGGQQNVSPYEKIALHLSSAASEKEADEIALLVRTFQLPEILKTESDAVRRLAERMTTRGSLGVMGAVPPPVSSFGTARKPEYEDVLKECGEIREQHDRMVNRAVRAVTMLRDKYDWKQRVEVEVEEPEELEWDPRMGMPNGEPQGVPSLNSDDDGMDDSQDGNSDEDEVEGELVRTPAPQTPQPTDSQESMGMQVQARTPTPVNPMAL
ncbi:hypothetical protein PC9H_001990 [Pleurotus ostreatus]|uniref:Mediator complex subunit 8 n=1 Tax=Pleurotus ostreatus TaxID=5322 RepID=A0A8H6ZPI3_PLEOS|nr:uncharacterized protein PC9H_001990 [Pleurotus ostreatus]KAF7419400.1 hypothetical protein PC9H_001990 [Pleurotus ostreatus]KAJ8689808.1 hypothetical protein PTI98_012669 [Pleurotus ostreatus]